MICNGLNDFRGKRVLMLQGPVGPFFARFATDLMLAGAVVFKVNFNGGDWLFSQRGSFSRVFNFRGDFDAWSDYLDDLLMRLNIETVFLFGDCRPVHVAAIPLIKQRGIEIGVFEEGYLRPDFITLERGGVNSNSSLPKNPGFYLSQACQPQPCASPLGSVYGDAAKWGMLYFSASSLAGLLFRNYRHHRRLGFGDGPFWLLSFWRKYRYGFTERRILPELIGEDSNRFYLVSLQTQGDAQMSVHSDFESVAQFIDHAVTSFARHAPKESRLVIKHHPLDRGYSDYATLIRRLARQHRLGQRCSYIHDQHLPTLLQHARGVVVVNSTVGLSAVGEGVPVKVCGEAIYDLQGLTFQGSLDAFWKHCHLAVPNAALYQAFRNYLIAHTQHQGSFYKRLPGVSFQSGVLWADHGVKASYPHDRNDRALVNPAARSRKQAS